MITKLNNQIIHFIYVVANAFYLHYAKVLFKLCLNVLLIEF